jgi:hypothetical protein
LLIAVNPLVFLVFTALLALGYYIDACCHYNQLGIEILADFVAEIIFQNS